jgi:hypothetical protein
MLRLYPEYFRAALRNTVRLTKQIFGCPVRKGTRSAHDVTRYGNSSVEICPTQ